MDAINHDFTSADYEAAKATFQTEALEKGVQKVMEENKLDSIIGPTDGPLASISAAIGKLLRPVQRFAVDTHLGGPIATMPVGLLSLYGRPFGLSVMTLPNHDIVLLKVLSAWEATFPRRAWPTPLLRQETHL